MNALVTPETAEQELRYDIGGFSRSPLGFARYAYWTPEELRAGAGPRKWQEEILLYIGAHLSDASKRFTPCQIAVSSGHDIGKSALISMVTNWGMSTCEDCKVVITANTGTQLTTKTVPEVTKWFKAAINAHWFDVKAQSITVRDPGHERMWRSDFITWSEKNTEAFAGLHNKGKRIIVIFDEASSIADTVWEVTEGALLDEETEIIWLAFGNPTQNTGRFRECFGKFKHRWKTFQIDSRTVDGTNKGKIKQWIDDYGEDSDFVRVRVRGEFPRAGSNQFISSESVSFCRKYHAESYERLPKILSCDVARFGDDQTVIGIRQGRKLRLIGRFRGLDTVQVAERLIELIKQEKPDATIVDADGIGAGVVDQIKFRGYGARLFEFHGGLPANAAETYFNRIAECWGMMRDWLKSGAEIPDDPDLDTNLTGRQYGFSNKGQIQLERKVDMKARGLESPDDADMLAMTFSVDVVAPPEPEPQRYWEPSTMQSSWMA